MLFVLVKSYLNRVHSDSAVVHMVFGISNDQFGIVQHFVK